MLPNSQLDSSLQRWTRGMTPLLLTCAMLYCTLNHCLARQIASKADANVAEDDLAPALLHAVVHCSAAAYESGPISNYLKWNGLGLKLIGEPFEVPEQKIRGFVARKGKTLIVVFRGTVITEMTNWKTNIDLQPTPIEPQSKAHVHAGFRNAYLLVKPQLVAILTETQQPDDRIVFTGHSLGAALAIMAAQDLNRLEAHPRVYTFGQPQVGNDAFSKCCPGKLYRFVHDKDPVARIPEIRGYQHFGELIYFNDKHERAGRNKALVILKNSFATYQRLKEIRASQKLDKSLSEIAKEQAGDAGKLLVEAVADHSLTAHYVPCVEKNFPVPKTSP